MWVCMQINVLACVFNFVWHQGLVVHVIWADAGRMPNDAVSRVQCTLPPDLARAKFLAHANYTLFCTSRAAFVCKKLISNFPVLPLENLGLENGGISKMLF